MIFDGLSNRVISRAIVVHREFVRGFVLYPFVLFVSFVVQKRMFPMSKKRTRLESFLFDVLQPTIPILPYDTKAATWHGKERARLAAHGQPPSFADGQIAAIAVTNDLTVVTRNTSDFALFQGITVENWMQNAG